MMFNRILIFSVCLLMFSCAVQKRKYQKGYHVEWTHKKSQNIADRSKTAGYHGESGTTPGNVLEHQTVPYASAEKSGISPAQKTAVLLKNDEPCDELIFKDGTELKVRISEISEETIKYKKCDMPDGPVYVVNKSSLFMIKYANGTREIFKQEPKSKSVYQRNEPDRPAVGHPKAIPSMIAGICALASGYMGLLFMEFFPGAGIALLIVGLIGAVIAISFGNIAIREIEARPDMFRKKGAAVAGRILGRIYMYIFATIAFIAFLIYLTL